MSEQDPLWYKDAIFYQTHVKSFFDSDGDGIGDFNGLSARLDYIAQLGVDTIWLLPFYPSPLKDDGYDIADYRGVHPAYGTMRDFRRFVREAHARGLKVLIELVVNHTSDQHPWFQRARRAKPGSVARDFYVWSNTHDRYGGTRIIFTDTEKSNWQWDQEAGAYYWHRFFSHQPDLNFDNPHVVKAVIAVMRHWLDTGVDGMRLDAVPYLCEREGTSNENLPETHAVLKQLRAALDQSHPGRVFLAEANQWPEDVLPYFGDGDECHMAFHFPLMPRMYMALAREDRYPITDIMRQTPEIPANCQWALFLRNHDELTLEMVTAEERDYLWDAYAKDLRARLNVGIRRRLAPLMDNNRRKVELLNCLLMSMPGTPIIYYGDELGMGDNIYIGDRNGVRTPMQWSEDRNGGFSHADPARLYLPPVMDPVYGYRSVNVESQLGNPSSLLNWMRRLIQVRRSRRIFGRGSLRFLYPANRRVLAYLREYEGETVLCVANLSRAVQGVELDLAEFKGTVPIELTGQSTLPSIGELPYFVTLPGHGFYWFLLAPGPAEPEPEGVLPMPDPPTLVVRNGLASITQGAARRVLEAEILPRFLPKQRWYGEKGQALSAVTLDDWAEIGDGAARNWLLLIVAVTRADGVRRRYFLPVAALWDHPTEEMAATASPVLMARLRRGAHGGMLHDATDDPGLAAALLAAFAAGTTLKGGRATFAFRPTALLDETAAPPAAAGGAVRRIAAEQSNSSIAIDDAMVLKLVRRCEAGGSLETEMGRFLSTVARFPYTPPLLGELVMQEEEGAVVTLATLQAYVENQGDAWSWLTGQLERFLDEITLLAPEEGQALLQKGNPVLGAFVELLAERTALLHRALSPHGGADPAFAPEPILAEDLAAWRLHAHLQADTVLDMLDEPDFAEGVQLLARGTDLHRHIDDAMPRTVAGWKCRVHGDYHLGQILVVRNDISIIDFEGEPTKSLAERAALQSPLRDVAGMLRSFDYAASSVLRRMNAARPGAQEALAPMVRDWTSRAEALFVAHYRAATADLVTVPADDGIFFALLDLFLIDKACYELTYEIANRPSWRPVAARGILNLLDGKERGVG